MPPPFNMQGNEGGATVTARNDELFYTTCSNININGVAYNNCDIYYSRLIWDQWTPLVRLDFNRDDSWESQPSVSADGKTLYFASDRPGGYGGTDIWVVYKDENNNWGKPQNLGPAINTPGNEKTPFIHTDSQTLYFSSANRYDENDSLFPGHRGLGGYDIFFSRFTNDKWSKPKNIGYPINSEADDLSFFVSTDGTTGYFSSNKIGSSGKYNLYAFDLYQDARPEKVVFIKGEIKDEFDIPVFDSKVELKSVTTQRVTTVDVDSFSGKYVATAIFDDDFVLTVKKPDHIYQSRYIDKDSAIFEAPVEINFEIEKVEAGKTYELHDILYPTNSAELSNRSRVILDEFIVFLRDNPGIRVTIYGHTDDVGDDAFNLDLSKRRALSVYDYLTGKGIPSSRLSWQGYGKTRPVADNTTEEGRAKNRRTEFVISNK
jgi:outer membrane protein OmpA-like peptidoglycan-associated protein